MLQGLFKLFEFTFIIYNVLRAEFYPKQFVVIKLNMATIRLSMYKHHRFYMQPQAIKFATLRPTFSTILCKAGILPNIE